MSEQPHWERGYRMHGYWIGIVRIGWVGLPPRPYRVTAEGYGWGFGNDKTQGRTRPLRQAKAAVEKAYREAQQREPMP